MRYIQLAGSQHLYTRINIGPAYRIVTYLADRGNGGECWTVKSDRDLLTVSNTDLLFSHGRTHEQLLSSSFPPVTSNFDLRP